MVYDISGNELSGANVLYAPVFPDVLDRTIGCTLLAYSGFWMYKSTALISVSGKVKIAIDAEDGARVSMFNIYEYAEAVTDTITYVQALRENVFTNNEFEYTPSSASVKYIRVTLVLSAAYTKEMKPLKFISAGELRICKLPSIGDANGIIKFSYIVDGTTFTAGNLLLPPNYSIHGSPVPLILLLHGTSSMNTWTQDIGTNSGTSTRYLLNYLLNEGFAVFDCYNFTSKYYSESYQNQAAPLKIFRHAYVSGAKFVCDKYNVDINNICAYSMSAGGYIAYDFIHSRDNGVNLKAMAMLCPSSGFVGSVFRAYFLHKSMRAIIVDYLGLSGKTGADTFINTEKGLDNATCRAFVEGNLDAFASMIASSIGVNGATFEEQYLWMTTWTSTLPQWMVDLDLPAIPSVYTTSPAEGIAKFVEHPELTAYTSVPTKYWQAFDDENVMAHVNYTAYTWLKNGGSPVYWRTMPNNTGKHHAVDTAASALKSSGTTRLGIAYSNIATAYVEMADFFYHYMAQ